MENGNWILDAGYWILVTGNRELDARCRKLEIWKLGTFVAKRRTRRGGGNWILETGNLELGKDIN